MSTLTNIHTLTHTHTHLFPFPLPSLFHAHTHTSHTHIPLTLTQTLHVHSQIYTHIITHVHIHNSHTSLLCFTLASHPYNIAHTHTYLKLLYPHTSNTPHTFTHLHALHMHVHTSSRTCLRSYARLALTHIPLTLTLWYTHWEQVPRLRTPSVWTVSCQLRSIHCSDIRTAGPSRTSCTVCCNSQGDLRTLISLGP